MKELRFFLGVAVCCTLLAACKQKSTIDLVKQKAAGELLRTEMKSNDLDSVVVLMMTTSTGEVRMQFKMVNDPVKKKFVFTSVARAEMEIEPGVLVAPFAVMAAMDESGANMDESVDAGTGRLEINGRTYVDDEASAKGGYGFINLSRCITLPSTVGLVNFVDLSFNQKSSEFVKRMNAMSFGAPSEKSPFAQTEITPALVGDYTVGKSFKLTPTQILTAWNGLANNGKVMAPTFVEMDTTTLNASMCNPTTVQAMRDLVVANGASECSSTTGLGFYKTVTISEESQLVTGAFCSFYPAVNPTYSYLVLVYHTNENGVSTHTVLNTVKTAGKKVLFGLAAL